MREIPGPLCKEHPKILGFGSAKTERDEGAQVCRNASRLLDESSDRTVGTQTTLIHASEDGNLSGIRSGKKFHKMRL